MKKTSHEQKFIKRQGNMEGARMRNRIKELRVQLAITQKQLADAVCVSTRTIISLEKGQCNPSVLLAYHIAKELRVTIEELFMWGG